MILNRGKKITTFFLMFYYRDWWNLEKSTWRSWIKKFLISILNWHFFPLSCSFFFFFFLMDFGFFKSYNGWYEPKVKLWEISKMVQKEAQEQAEAQATWSLQLPGWTFRFLSNFYLLIISLGVFYWIRVSNAMFFLQMEKMKVIISWKMFTLVRLKWIHALWPVS